MFQSSFQWQNQQQRIITCAVCGGIMFTVIAEETLPLLSKEHDCQHLSKHTHSSEYPIPEFRLDGIVFASSGTTLSVASVSN